MWRWNWSIRAWLTSLGVAVALPVLILLGWIFGLEVRHESEYARTIALRIVRTAATRIASQHATSAAVLRQIAQRPAIRDFDGVTCDSLFAVAGIFPQSSDLLFYDRTGKLVCSGRPQGEGVLISRTSQPMALAALRSGRLRSGQPIVRLIRGRWILILLEPVAGTGGSPAGSLVFLQLLDFNRTEPALPNLMMTILDRDGTVLARSRGAEHLIGRNAGKTEVAEIALKEGEGKAEAHGLDGVARQYGFTRVPDLQWTIFAGAPSTHVLGSVREMYRFGIFGGVLILLMIAIVVSVITRELRKPIGALLSAAESAARTGYGRAEVTGGPAEFVALTMAFNEMMDRRSAAEQRTLESERNLKALSERLLTVQEQERMRVAREIHDDLGQALTALKMDVIGLVEKSRPSPDMRPMVDRILRTLDATVTAVQRISSELRPSVLDDLGLFAAIESETQLFEQRTGIECELSVPDDPSEIERASATAIYRIVQEALTNVARHSNATRVEVRLRERGGELLLEVRDDGTGIAPERITDPASIGLAGIRERADMLSGTALIEGIPGRGTIVSIRIPLDVPAGRDA